ncbi:Cut9-interacting protein scn1 [Coemansia brasiliensis]|uniref:Cut9-interacting protein scn1 n=1 Tax=Coemansia brasiliensis TaxID=2650707 RepID=A0A9W8IE01_9FUNG|nr:Cut9-interacting protein scn1 [Coemansia brasiliensis]
MTPKAIVYDVHCHIHETPSTFKDLDNDGHTVYCVQATKYSDWKEVLDLKENFAKIVIPAFGVHPWFVERVQSGEIPSTWASELRQILTQHKGILGECGLDKAARNSASLIPFEPQVKILEMQLDIAHDLNIPVSLHCVRAFGALADMLCKFEKTQRLPPRIMLHSYSGSPDMLQQIFLRGELGQRIYVSFSRFVNCRNRTKSVECIRIVPAERLLVESDLHDASSTAEALEAAITLVAEARGWEFSQTKEILAANSRAFFRYF